jgi:hypothetical protein
MPNLDELQATTDLLWGMQLEDTIFRRSATLKMLKEECSKEFTGGRAIQEPFIYDKTKGGAIDPDETVNVDIVDVIAGTTFRPKLYEENVSELLYRIHVENKGDAAKIKILDAKLEVAAMTQSERLAIDIHRHGQATGTGVSDDRHKKLNGWAEMFNDGVNNSWDGNRFPLYGGETRTAVGSSLNSTPLWLGDSSGNPGQISYSRLLDIIAGPEKFGGKPKYGFSSVRGINLMIEKFQNQQRFQQESNPVIGFESYKVGECSFFKDPYFPSTADGVNDSNTGSYLPTVFTTSSTVTSASGLPNATLLTGIGEVLVVIDPSSIDFYVDNSELFGFGNTGWKVGNNHLVVSNQFLAALNMVCRNPRYNRQAYGYNA